MKLILENNGAIISTKEVPNNITMNDIFVGSDYIAMKFFTKEEIAYCLENMEYPSTDENINEVLKSKFIKALGECNDADYMLIAEAIYEVENNLKF